MPEPVRQANHLVKQKVQQGVGTSGRESNDYVHFAVPSTMAGCHFLKLILKEYGFPDFHKLKLFETIYGKTGTEYAFSTSL